MPPEHINPPLRADHVGSLLHPPEIFDARENLANGVMSSDVLREVENEAIADMIPKLEEATGIQAIHRQNPGCNSE